MSQLKSRPNESLAGLSIPFLLATPVALFTYGDTGVVLADAVSVLGFFIFLRYLRHPEALFLSASILISFVLCTTHIILNDRDSIYPLGSLVFFFKPCFAYFSAFYLFKQRQSISIFFYRFNAFSLLCLASVIFTIMYQNNGLVRADSYLNGSIFGLKIFGSYGVNSLAIFFSMCSYMAAYPLAVVKGRIARLAFCLVAIGFAYLALMSLSRTAALGAIAMWSTLALLHANRSPLTAAFFFLLLLAGTTFVLSSLSASDMLAAKVSQIQQGLATGDFDSLSSGRLSLYYAATLDILQNPISGSAFHGFTAGAEALTAFDELSGLSPHNQYITTVWKMGPIAALFYFMMLVAMVRKSLKQSSISDRRWLIGLLLGTFVIFCSTWDVLIVPNVGALVFFVLGLFASRDKISYE